MCSADSIVIMIVIFTNLFNKLELTSSVFKGILMGTVNTYITRGVNLRVNKDLVQGYENAHKKVFVYL